MSDAEEATPKKFHFTEFTKIHLDADDVIIFNIDSPMSFDDLEAARKSIRSNLDHNTIYNPFLILPKGVSIEVISRKDFQYLVRKDSQNG